ncbi:MAG: metallophosphoesterase family protein [Verrucomicrobia bacterium]|nr:metallophosphoesterase family protein [Verrucomicrobiota bacterium]
MAREIEAFYQLAIDHLSNSSHWLGDPPDHDSFFKIERWRYRAEIFQPFAQRLTLPAAAQVRFFGDLHGDIHSLNAQLEKLNSEGVLSGFKIARADTTLVFLGDYSDRGVYGVEVIYTLLRLKLANPDQVILVRGNHEDIALNESYNFDRECDFKFGPEAQAFGKILRTYDFLPVVLYVGSGRDYVQCNHGGIEPGYNPSSLLTASPKKPFQLLGALERGKFADRLPESFASFSALSDAERGVRIRQNEMVQRHHAAGIAESIRAWLREERLHRLSNRSAVVERWAQLALRRNADESSPECGQL